MFSGSPPFNTIFNPFSMSVIWCLLGLPVVYTFIRWISGRKGLWGVCPGGLSKIFIAIAIFLASYCYYFYSSGEDNSGGINKIAAPLFTMTFGIIGFLILDALSTVVITRPAPEEVGSPEDGGLSSLGSIPEVLTTVFSSQFWSILDEFFHYYVSNHVKPRSGNGDVVVDNFKIEAAFKQFAQQRKKSQKGGAGSHNKSTTSAKSNEATARSGWRRKRM